MKQVIIMAMLAAGLMLAGCSKSESENMETGDNSGNAALVEKLTKEIKQHIVGTWVRDGWCYVDEDVLFDNPPVSQIILEDVQDLNGTGDLTVFSFTVGGEVTLRFLDKNESGDGVTFYGNLSIKARGTAVDSQGLSDAPPMGIDISYKDGLPDNYGVSPFNECEHFFRVLFSKDYRKIFLIHRPSKIMQVYSRQ